MVDFTTHLRGLFQDPTESLGFLVCPLLHINRSPVEYMRSVWKGQGMERNEGQGCDLLSKVATFSSCSSFSLLSTPLVIVDVKG